MPKSLWQRVKSVIPLCYRVVWLMRDRNLSVNILWARGRLIAEKDLWYWSKTWQNAEDMVEKQLCEGKFEDFKDISMLIEVLTQNQPDLLAQALRQNPHD